MSKTGLTTKEKLEQLKEFYYKYQGVNPDIYGMENVCPFYGNAYLHGCDELCHSFPELTSDDEPSCPCHVWGPELALTKLENLLIQEKMIEG